MADADCPFLAESPCSITCMFRGLNGEAGSCMLIKNTGDFLLYFKHYHDSHEHPISHPAISVPTTLGGITTAMPLIKAAILIQEFMGNESMDNTGKTYGFDFQISSADPERPPMLASLEQHPDWPNSINIITWSQYIAWNGGGPQPY